MADPASTALEQQRLVKIACDAHVKRVSLAKKGQGVDRHLYGMHSLAKQMQVRIPKYHIPEIFTGIVFIYSITFYLDVAWSRLRYDILSTSNCGGYSLSSFGFGPVVPDGWGYIIYNSL